jgi:hypothetical protein
VPTILDVRKINTHSLTPEGPSDCIFQQFLRVGPAHSTNEQVYRVNDGSVPRTRAPATTLEFTADGQVIFGVPGPADARVYRVGRWTATAQNELRLEWNEPLPDTVIEIVSCENDRLELRVRSGSLD